MTLSWPSKDPDEVLDYTLDWASRLDGDTIATSTWTVPTGLTKGADMVVAGSTATIVWLQGGVAGERYSVSNRVVTAAGRTMDQSVIIKAASK